MNLFLRRAMMGSAGAPSGSCVPSLWVEPTPTMPAVTASVTTPAEFQAAVAAAGPGDRINFTGSGRINTASPGGSSFAINGLEGTEANPIWITSDAGVTVSSDSDYGGYGIYLRTDCKWVRIVGLDIRQCTTAIWMGTNDAAGGDASGVEDCQVINCHVEDNDDAMIACRSGKRLDVLGCTIANHTLADVDDTIDQHQGEGIYYGVGNTLNQWVTGGVIRGNTSIQNGGFTSNMIEVKGPCKQITVEYNVGIGEDRSGLGSVVGQGIITAGAGWQTNTGGNSAANREIDPEIVVRYNIVGVARENNENESNPGGSAGLNDPTGFYFTGPVNAYGNVAYDCDKANMEIWHQPVSTTGGTYQTYKIHDNTFYGGGRSLYVNGSGSPTVETRNNLSDQAFDGLSAHSSDRVNATSADFVGPVTGAADNGLGFDLAPGSASVDAGLDTSLMALDGDEAGTRGEAIRGAGRDQGAFERCPE